MGHEDCLAANTRSTGPQQRNTDDHSCPVDTAERLSSAVWRTAGVDDWRRRLFACDFPSSTADDECVLGDIADKRFRLLRSVLPFCGLSVCLFVSATFLHCIVLKRQKLSTKFLLHTTITRLFQIALKFGLHQSTPSSLPVVFSLADVGQHGRAE